MAGDRSPQPSKEAWEAWKPEIHRWYLLENWTCVDIQKALGGHHFSVSERQIKNRLSEWKFERKKTPYNLYLAMSVIADYHRAGGVEVEFEVPKRETRVSYSVQKVKKECERVKKRYDNPEKHLEPLKWPTLYDAQTILQEADISWRERGLPVQQTLITGFPPNNDVVPWNGQYHDLPPRHHPSKMEVNIVLQHECTSTATPSFRSTSLLTKSPTDLSVSNYQHSQAFQTLQIANGRPTTYTPQSEESPPSLPSPKSESSLSSSCQSPISPVFGQELKAPSSAHTMKPICVRQSVPQRSRMPISPASLVRSPPIKMEQLPPSWALPMDEIPAPRKVGLFKKTNSTFSICRRCEPPHSHSDFDFSGAIDSLENQSSVIKQESFDQAEFFDESSLDQDVSPEDHKLTASRWAAPYYMQYVSNFSEADLQRTKDRSMNALWYALEHKSEWILPCLSWTVLILGQTERMNQLAEFLQASREVINRHQDYKDSFIYDVPFRYCWAWASNNEEEMVEAGNCLGRSHDQIRTIWGEDHPNFFVSGYLYAFHLIRQGHFKKAIQLLTKQLAVCEDKMGRHDLLTISCLSVVSRAHAEMENFGQARYYLRKAVKATQYLEEAITHPEIHRPVLQRFRLSLLARHAELMFHLDDYLDAEKQLWSVLRVRGQRYGLKAVDTWNAAHGLGYVLQNTGQEGVWEELHDYMRKGNDWEQLRDWCRQSGEMSPPPPPKPPLWWPFTLAVQKRLAAEVESPPPNTETHQTCALPPVSPNRAHATFAPMANG
ncbi:hypothetical protein H2200_008966 [Cladophialophora chaetospira]|uniref:Clr5 domain-containing protein n=1 Tax=Cladophialophora chaetospira TaxID=386627 RepID=A0AA39CG68_9EURO|nr:hypothetical protein H2200_008966 [Cladophialophora chaetospira]